MAQGTQLILCCKDFTRDRVHFVDTRSTAGFFQLQTLRGFFQ
ncbi:MULTISPECIES: hypothetical protein [Leptolyngbya]|nr:hypothetical protein [Leptolyngbya sp. FACHB-1624]